MGFYFAIGSQKVNPYISILVQGCVNLDRAQRSFVPGIGNLFATRL